MEEYNLKIIENNFPGIKDCFDFCIFNLKMCGYSNAKIQINSGTYKINGKRIKVIKCHLYLAEKQKILTFYYDRLNSVKYYRYKERNPDMSFSNFKRVDIKHIDELKETLNNIVFKI